MRVAVCVSGEGVEQNEDRGLGEGIDHAYHEKKRAQTNDRSRRDPNAVAFEDAKRDEGHREGGEHVAEGDRQGEDDRENEAQRAKHALCPVAHEERPAGAKQTFSSGKPGAETTHQLREAVARHRPVSDEARKPRDAPEHHLDRQVEERKTQHPRQAGRRRKDVREGEEQYQPGPTASAQKRDQVVDGDDISG